MSRSINRTVGARSLIAAAALSTLGVFAVQSHATTLTWDNGGADNLWSNGANWNAANNTTIPQVGDTAVFVSASNIPAGTTINTGGDQTVLGISIGNSSATTGYVPNFTIADNTLRLKGRVLGVDANNAAIGGTGANGSDGATVLQIKVNTLTNPPLGVSVGNYTILSNVILSVNGSGIDPNIAVQSTNATLALNGVVSTEPNNPNATPPTVFRKGMNLVGGGTLSLSNAGNTYLGNTTVTSGTLLARASASNNGTPSAFGTEVSPILLGSADTSPGASVQLLASDSATIARNISVPSTPANGPGNPNSTPVVPVGTGNATIGGGTQGASPATFTGTISLARSVRFSSFGNGANTVDITGQITGTGAVSKINPGTVRFNNPANNYVGATTFTAGTLLLGASEVIPNASNLTFAGGTLATGGLNETANAVNVTVSSAIDFGSSGILNLASSAASWTAATNLQLLNWNGLPGGTGLTQFIVGGTPLTGDQLTAIDFINPAGLPAGSYDGLQLPGGEIVPNPVPEPTALALAALAAPVLLRRRRAAQC